MLNILVNNIRFSLYFSHTRTILPECTICRIISESNEIISEGIALVHYKDRFCRKIGRKISLAKALKKSRLNKKTRKQFWIEYFKICEKDIYEYHYGTSS